LRVENAAAIPQPILAKSAAGWRQAWRAGDDFLPFATNSRGKVSTDPCAVG